MPPFLASSQSRFLSRRGCDDGQIRLETLASLWCVTLEKTFETQSSLIAYGRQHDGPVVLKVLKQQGDEWRSGEVLDAFRGHGVVRVYAHVPGVLLLERLAPGHSLVRVTTSNRDEEATTILAQVIQQMPATQPLNTFPTGQDWAKAFQQYSASGGDQISRDLVEVASRVYSNLCSSQSNQRLLHGDLHHDNVLFDSERGWVAIDPKGVIGELEYEIGAILRNPIEALDLFTSPARVQRQVEYFASRLSLDRERMLAWGFAQAVLSAIWEIEDGFVVDATNPSIRLANVIRPMLPPGDAA